LTGATFDQILPGAHIRGLDPTGIVEIVKVSRFGPDAPRLPQRSQDGSEAVAHFVAPI
jgi:hypothetical protein